MKRKPMLLKRLSTSRANEVKRTIGLIGINRGAGVTYTGMLLAHYFAFEKRAKTAYLECNNHQDFAKLQEAFEWSEEDERFFSLDKISYYKQLSQNQIPDIMNNDYDCYIIDFGTDFTNSMEEFIRCGNKIVLGGSAIWNQSKILRFIKSMKNINGGDNWIYIIPGAERRLVMGMAHKTHRRFYSIPFEPNPTLISKETHKLFYSLFG